jgi:hypothetical protein
MRAADVIGICLVAGMVTFLVGAGGWRQAYEAPLVESLRVIHEDRRRRAWIHLWMIPAMFLTAGGVAGYAALAPGELAVALTLVGAVVYALGAVCWIASLAFRLTVVPWAAERTVADGAPPEAFPALDRWAGSLYVVHMASAYAASAIIGGAVLAGGDLPTWLGWAGIIWGASFLVGFVATRFAGPFNPPFWAHVYTGLLGAMLLSGG